MAQLPLYYKNGKAVAPPLKRWKENYLFLLVFVAFVVLLTGNLWLVPEPDESSTEYSKFNPSGALSSLNVEPFAETLDDSDRVEIRSLNENAPRPNASNPKLGIVVLEAEESSPKKEAVEPGQERSPIPTPDEMEQGQHSDVVNENGNTEKTDASQSPDTHPTSSSSQPPSSPPAEAANSVPEQRRREIVELARNAWNDYVKNAWGDNELKPISHKGHSPVIFGKTQLGATIVDSLDTLFLMGLREEFEKAKEWVQLSLDFDRVSEQS